VYLLTGCGKLVGGKGVKHEGIIGIRGCASLISTGSFSVFEAVLSARHGLVRFLFQCESGKPGHFMRNREAVSSP